MKWINKGKEPINKQVYDFENYNIFIFGAGDIGRALSITLQRFDLFSGFIDNDPKKQEMGCWGQKVYSYIDFKKNIEKPFVIVAATHQNEKVMCQQITKDNIPYMCAEEFLNKYLPPYLYFKKNILMMGLSQICVTERCSLKCEKCAHACYAVSNDAIDLSLNEVKNSVDIFFSKIDYIQEFVLIGGEPLLYSDLNEAVRYIGERYRHKIGIFSITTNGTISPKDSLLKSCRKYDVFFRISNYSIAVPRLVDKYKSLTNMLETENIQYYLGKPEEEWWDYGFTESFEKCNENELINRFDECATPCRETRNGRLYYCVMARTVSDNLHLGIGREDYLDLSSLTNDEAGRRILLEYNMGYSDKGYLSMCARCRGKDCLNYPVLAAKQMKR